MKCKYPEDESKCNWKIEVSNEWDGYGIDARQIEIIWMECTKCGLQRDYDPDDQGKDIPKGLSIHMVVNVYLTQFKIN